jgi:hypothetical protein
MKHKPPTTGLPPLIADAPPVSTVRQRNHPGQLQIAHRKQLHNKKDQHERQ